MAIMVAIHRHGLTGDLFESWWSMDGGISNLSSSISMYIDYSIKLEWWGFMSFFDYGAAFLWFFFLWRFIILTRNETVY
jgi:hypothetical protein